MSFFTASSTPLWSCSSPAGLLHIHHCFSSIPTIPPLYMSKLTAPCLSNFVTTSFSLTVPYFWLYVLFSPNSLPPASCFILQSREDREHNLKTSQSTDTAAWPNFFHLPITIAKRTGLSADPWCDTSLTLTLSHTCPTPPSGTSLPLQSSSCNITVPRWEPYHVVCLHNMMIITDNLLAPK